jgi:hypothetical protein
MKDRIFPTLKQDEGIASEKEYSGINWDKFTSEFDPSKVVKTASKLPEGLEAILEQNIVDDSVRQAKKYNFELDKDEKSEEDDEKEEKKPKSKKPKDDEVEEECKEVCEDEEDDGEDDGDEDSDDVKMQKVRKMKKQGRMKKVCFTSADQISAEAIEKAKASGDEVLANTILAARKQRRIHLASKIAEAEASMQRTAAVVEEDEVSKKIQQRDEYRKKLAARIESNIKQASASKIKVTVASNTEFKNPVAFKTAEKRAFAEAAIDQGFPKEYVVQMLGEKTASVSTEAEDGIKKVMASDIPVNMKKAALQGMIKTAELDSAQKQRIIDYWIKDLHYGDEEWVKNWVNKNYK